MSCHLVCCFVHEHFLCGGNYGPSLPVCGENRKLGQLRTQCKGFFLHPIKCGYYFKCINCINLLHRWLLWYANTPNIYIYMYVCYIYIYVYITYWSAVCFSQIDSIRQTLFTHWHLSIPLISFALVAGFCETDHHQPRHHVKLTTAPCHSLPYPSACSMSATNSSKVSSGILLESCGPPTTAISCHSDSVMALHITLFTSW